MDNRVDDQAINLPTQVQSPLRPTIGEEHFVKEQERCIEDHNNKRRYRNEAYRHSGGGVFFRLHVYGGLQHISVCGTRALLHTFTERPLGGTGVVHYLHGHVTVDLYVKHTRLSQRQRRHTVKHGYDSHARFLPCHGQ